MLGRHLRRAAKAPSCSGASGALQQDPTELWFSPWTTVELIGASSHIGQETATRPALERLPAGTSASGNDWTEECIATLDLEATAIVEKPACQPFADR